MTVIETLFLIYTRNVVETCRLFTKARSPCFPGHRANMHFPDNLTVMHIRLCSGEANISRNDVCYFQAWPTETTYNVFHYLSLLYWLDFDIWSVPCPENGWNPKKHFHLSPCFQLYILWGRNTFILHLATEVLGFIATKLVLIHLTQWRKE